MTKTNLGLIEYARVQLGKPYWYGTFGQMSTESLYRNKAKQYPGYYDRSKYKQGWSHQYNQRVHDCVGLIKGYLWSDTPTSVPKYNSSQDVSANGMLSVCKKKGNISTIPDVPGVLVFFNGHVGVYEGNGYVIEARGHDYGVVRTKLSNRPWAHWGYCPYIAYSGGVANPVSNPVVNTKKSIGQYAKEVIDGKYGFGHEVREKNLMAAGCPYNYEDIRAEVNRQTKVSPPVSQKSYFPKYAGKSTSIVDALKSMKIAHSFSYRKKIASANGMKTYAGLPNQNTKLLFLLKQGRLVNPK